MNHHYAPGNAIYSDDARERAIARGASAEDFTPIAEGAAEPAPTPAASAPTPTAEPAAAVPPVWRHGPSGALYHDEARQSAIRNSRAATTDFTLYDEVAEAVAAAAAAAPIPAAEPEPEPEPEPSPRRRR